MKFEKYSKIRRLGDEENDGILKGEVVVMEKLDGANASIWFDDDNDAIVYAGRNGIQGRVKIDTGEIIGDSFRGLGAWIAEQLVNHSFMDELIDSNIRCYGEWLVKHKVEYKPEFMSQFYLYDLEKDGAMVPAQHIKSWAEYLGIPTAPTITIVHDPKVDELRELVGTSDMAVTRGEGIVIKNFDFINKFGRKAHAKFVCEKFQENNGAKIKSPRDYGDIDGTVDAVIDGFVTEARINKLMFKIHDETGEFASAKWTGRMLGQHWQDMWNEEAHGIMKVVGANDFNFRRFKTKHDVAVREIFFRIMAEAAENE